MFIVTNREINDRKRGLNKFGGKPNPEGANELRIVEAIKEGRDWKVYILPDELTDDDKLAVRLKREVGLKDPKDPADPSIPYYASDYVAARLQRSIPKDRRHILLYVHGFNNDMKDVLDQAHALGTKYRMEVIAFSWPALGGGAISGTLNYRRDKVTARLSVGALDRTIDKLHTFVKQANLKLMAKITREADRKFPDNPVERDAFIAQTAEDECPYCVSALFHSMGNYLFKHALLSDIFQSRAPVFDNVILAAADTNNEGHAKWVDMINCRGRVFITINEDDYALGASTLKLGDTQHARLGHYLRKLDAQRPIYVDFTEVDQVGKAHTYFIGGPTRNKKVARFFRHAFRGKRSETILKYHSDANIYRFR